MHRIKEAAPKEWPFFVIPTLEVYKVCKVHKV
jgi:hypothetical protein